MKKVLNKSKVFFKKNSATILTCVGAAGVVATAVSTATATTKVTKIIDLIESTSGEELTFQEKVRVAAPIYIPSVLLGTATITAIFGAHFLNRKRQASLVGAYTLLDQSYKSYKEKVDELYGEYSSNHIQEELAKDKYDEEPIIVSDGKELFYDMYSERYFEATREEVLIAENEMNKILCTDIGVGVNKFYELLDIDEMPEFNEIGWSVGQMSEMYWHAWIEFDHKQVTMDDGLECTIITFPLEPIVEYYDY